MSRKATAALQGGRFAVRCEDYTTRPTTEAAAHRLLAEVEQAGRCVYPHEVVRVDA